MGFRRRYRSLPDSMVRPLGGRGFTLVEMAVGLVILVLLFAAVVKGRDLIDHSHNKRMLGSLKALETAIWEYRDALERWPGDCDGDGVIGYRPVDGVDAGLALDAKLVDPLSLSCDAAATEDPEHKDTAFADLRLHQVLRQKTPNAVLARHPAGGLMHIGSLQDASSGESTNLIVLYHVTVATARYLDRHLDGSEDGRRGRLRRWDSSPGNLGIAWPAQDERLVAVSYQFENTLP